MEVERLEGRCIKSIGISKIRLLHLTGVYGVGWHVIMGLYIFISSCIAFYIESCHNHSICSHEGSTPFLNSLHYFTNFLYPPTSSIPGQNTSKDTSTE